MDQSNDLVGTLADLFSTKYDTMMMVDKAIIAVLPHLTTAIEEFRPLPPNTRVEWYSIDVNMIDGEEKIAVVGYIRNPDRRFDGTKIYGVVPTKVVLKEDKQAIIDYFTLTQHKRTFESAIKDDATVIH